MFNMAQIHSVITLHDLTAPQPLQSIIFCYEHLSLSHSGHAHRANATTKAIAPAGSAMIILPTCSIIAPSPAA